MTVRKTGLTNRQAKTVRASRRPRRTPGGTLVYGTDPLVIQDHYEIDYLHSYAEDSPFFLGLAEGILRGSECTGCGYRFATPRAYCLQCGAATQWFDLPLEGRIHTWTTCYYGSESFLNDVPFHLILVEFDGVDTLLLSRLRTRPHQRIRIGRKVRARFARNPQYRITDVYFVLA